MKMGGPYFLCPGLYRILVGARRVRVKLGISVGW